MSGEIKTVSWFVGRAGIIRDRGKRHILSNVAPGFTMCGQSIHRNGAVLADRNIKMGYACKRCLKSYQG